MNWYGACRSNYFRVTSVERLKELCRQGGLGGDAVWVQADGSVGFGGDNFLPCELFDEEGGESIEGQEFAHEICKILEPGEVVICMESGHEGLRYCSGSSIAFRMGADGEPQMLSVNLEDIYKMVVDEWGVCGTSQASY